MVKLGTGIIIASFLVIAACATTPGYTICNDLAGANCGNNTANVIISNQ